MFSKYQLLSSRQNINFNFSFVQRFPFTLKSVQFGKLSRSKSWHLIYINSFFFFFGNEWEKRRVASVKCILGECVYLNRKKIKLFLSRSISETRHANYNLDFGRRHIYFQWLQCLMLLLSQEGVCFGKWDSEKHYGKNITRKGGWHELRRWHCQQKLKEEIEEHSRKTEQLVQRQECDECICRREREPV